MKIFNIAFCVIFIVFAALQYNDPDPYLWVPIYLWVAFLCMQAAKNKFFPKAYIITIIVFSIYAIYKVVDQNGLLDWINEHHAENIAETMKAEKPWIEESREFFGLLILIGVLIIDLVYAKRKK
ncbi:MAG: transmembrane 220 family protein [Chitinophagaceae bacterium]|nr:transmembrane 220 family protein [Chitinophagaceae bacterium]